MLRDVDKAVGIDVHKKFLEVAFAQRGSREIELHRFERNAEGIYLLRNLVEGEGVQRVAMESSGVYWLSVYRALEDVCEVVVGNPRDIKNSKKRKTDVKDAVWIAQLALNDLIEPSVVPEKGEEELKSLLRYRVHLVQSCTSFKNKVHQILDKACIELSSVLSDIFGISGLKIINGILEGREIKEILSEIKDKRVKKKEMEIERAVRSKLSKNQAMIIESSLKMIKEIEKEISKIDSKINSLIKKFEKRIKILMGIPGVGYETSCTVLVETWEMKRFETPEKLASWAGIVPSVSQSAEKQRNGSITKRGNKYLRRSLIQAAQAVARTSDNTLADFYRRIAFRRGHSKAIVAVARKILVIAHHLLLNDEYYSEGEKKAKIPEFERQDPIDSLSSFIEGAKKLRELSFLSDTWKLVPM